jgi:DNA-binding transcriptional regulator GbsR (MarR family)
MNNTDNKELLLEAINGYDHFSMSQKIILNIILSFEQNGVAHIAITSITELSGFSKTIIYKSINKLIGMKVISKFKKEGEKVNYFELNKEKLQDIFDVYLKKQQILQKNYKK